MEGIGLSIVVVSVMQTELTPPSSPADVSWGDGTNVTWGDGTQVDWSANS